MGNNFLAVPPEPKKVILIFPPVVTKAILNISTNFEICSQHSERREITFIQLKKLNTKKLFSAYPPVVIQIKHFFFPLSRRGLDLLGLTRRRNKYIPLEVRWKMAWGKRNE
jgi:hypothetical protein